MTAEEISTLEHKLDGIKIKVDGIHVGLLYLFVVFALVMLFSPDEGQRMIGGVTCFWCLFFFMARPAEIKESSTLEHKLDGIKIKVGRVYVVLFCLCVAFGLAMAFSPDEDQRRTGMIFVFSMLVGGISALYDRYKKRSAP